MLPRLPVREQYEQAIAIGIVFSPLLLLALPFTQRYWAHISIGTTFSILWLTTLSGYFCFRKGIFSSLAFRIWQIFLFFIECTAMLGIFLLLSFEFGGATASFLAFFTYFGLALFSWKTLLRPRRNSQKANLRLIVSFSSLGAAGCSLLVTAFGSSLIHFLALALYLFFAIGNLALFIRSFHELQYSPQQGEWQTLTHQQSG